MWEKVAVMYKYAAINSSKIGDYESAAKYNAMAGDNYEAVGMLEKDAEMDEYAKFCQSKILE